MYRRLKNAGRVILDHGYLSPPLNWIQGVLGPRDFWVLTIEAYNLLRGACSLQVCRDAKRQTPGPTESMTHGFPGPAGLSAKVLIDFLPQLEWPSPTGLEAGTERFIPALNLKIAPRDGSGIGWHKWCAEWAHAAKKHTPLFESALSNPYWLIHASYQWISGVLASGGSDSDEFSAALTTLGLGALGAFPRVECDLCFRLAISQRLRCTHHNASRLVHGDGNAYTTQVQHSAEARRACRLLNWPARRPDFRLAGWPTNEEEVVCGLLWPLSHDQQQDAAAWLVATLRQFPNILALMPANILDLDTNVILQHMRRTLDENEWNYEAWAGKLFVAEEWLAALKKVAPGRRPSGMTEQNRERLLLADRLLLNGLAKSDIAAKLGISRSHLSNLWRRRAALDCPSG